MLTLIDRFRMFARAASVDDRIGSTEIAVYTMLLSIDNDLLFQEWFGCSDRRLQDMIQVGSVHTITKAKNRLKQLGWIDFKASGKKTTLYKLTVPDRATDTATDTATDSAKKGATDTAALNRLLDKTRQLDKAAAAATRAREEDSELGEVMRVFENNIHPLTGDVGKDTLIDLVDEYSAFWVTSAIEEAALSNGRSLRYITRILERWKRDGFKADRKKGSEHYGTGGIQGDMAGDGTEKSVYAAYLDGDTVKRSPYDLGGTSAEGGDSADDWGTPRGDPYGEGASSGSGGGRDQEST